MEDIFFFLRCFVPLMNFSKGTTILDQNSFEPQKDAEKMRHNVIF